MQKISVALANGEGGEFLIGIADDKDEMDPNRRWQGAASMEAFNSHLQAVHDVKPILDCFYEFLKCEGKPGYVLRVIIKSSPAVHFTSDRKVFLRYGAQSLPVIDPNEIVKLGTRKSGKTLLIELEPITPGFRDFRQEGEDVTFRPSWEEFKNGLVHRPTIVDQLKSILKAQNWAWLCGQTATGKTTVALHVALETATPARPALHLDLADDPNVSTAIDEIRSAAITTPLFIIDNVHVNPRAAATILRRWQENRSLSSMLLIGWPIDEKNRHLIAYKPGCLYVEIGEDDLEGIYKTLRRRLRPTEPSILSPTAAVITSLFKLRGGGNLIDFQNTAVTVLRSNRDVSIEKMAVEDYLRERYLDDCTSDERSDLMRLALFSELGMAVPNQCFVSRFERALSIGIVRESTHGQFAQHIRFRLWHQSLGGALLSVNKNPLDRSGEFLRASMASSFFAGQVSQRLWRDQELELSRSILRQSISSASGIPGLFGDNLSSAERILKLLDESGVSTFTESATSLTREAVARDLEKKLLATPVGDLSNFLGFVAKGNDLKPLYEMVVKALVDATCDPADNRLVYLIARTPLGSLASFLEFSSKRKELEPLVHTLNNELVTESEKVPETSWLIAQMWKTPLEQLANFLEFCAKQQSLEAVHKRLADLLLTETQMPLEQNRLLSRALATPLDHLSRFLKVCSELPTLNLIAARLETLLSEQPQLVAKAMLNTRFVQIAPLLTVAPQLGTAMLQVITDEEWQHSLPQMSQSPVTGFGPFSTRLRLLGFSDKAVTIATALVARADPADWHKIWKGVNNLSHVLRYADVSDIEKLHFLERVAPPKWLATRYYKEQIGDLAGGLFHLLAHQPQSVLNHFVLGALRTRVGRELLCIRDHQPRDAGAVLQVWAATELLGFHILVNKVQWPDSLLVAELLTVDFAHAPDIVGMGYIQQHLWMGLRLFARHHPNDIQLNALPVEDALERWKRTASEPDRTLTRRGWDFGMIRWLELSLKKSALVRDGTPLWQALEPDESVTHGPANN